MTAEKLNLIRLKRLFNMVSSNGMRDQEVIRKKKKKEVIRICFSIKDSDLITPRFLKNKIVNILKRC